MFHVSSVEGFSLHGVSRKGKVTFIGEATTASLSVYAPDSALGLLLSIALSFGQVFLVYRAITSLTIKRRIADGARDVARALLRVSGLSQRTQLATRITAVGWSNPGSSMEG